MKSCHRIVTFDIDGKVHRKGCIGNLGVTFEPETCPNLEIGCVFEWPDGSTVDERLMDERAEEMTPEEIQDAVGKATHGEKLSSTTLTVTPKPGENHWTEPQAPSAMDIRETGSHIAHHVQDAAWVIGIAILLGCIVNGCIGLIK